jgi:flagellar brake protein
MLQDTQPAVLSADGETDALAPFRTAQPMAIRALLSELKSHAASVHLLAPHGTSLSTLVWAVDAARQRLTLHPLADKADHECHALVEAGEATAVAYLDAVKLQFDLHALTVIHGPGGVVLQAELPQSLYRFQRRDSFRVRPLQARGPQLRLRHPAMPDMALTLRVLDFSLGGCAVLLPHNVPAMDIGSHLHGVQVHLDAQTLFNAQLQLKHAARFGDSSEGGTRLGCAWQPDTPAARHALQRCIEVAQRRGRRLNAE